MIQLENKSFYSVKSFTNNDIFYQVEVGNNQMIKYTCKNFEYSKIALSFNELIPAEVNQETDITEEQESSTTGHQENDNLTNKIANLLATCRGHKETPYLLTDDELTQVEQGANMIMEAINKNKHNLNRPNQKFSTQRR
ncbi:hypothetical protein G6F56_004335 [Rhizopus delemar]|nr:hypothetical protein G6F56_004335 [Rhizopus delemar]